MRFTRRHGTTLGLLAALLLTGSVHAAAQHGPAGQSKTGAAANVDWPRFGNTADNTRFSSLAQVNDSNVGQLGLAWTMAEDPNTAIWETDPWVVDRVSNLTTTIDQCRA